MREMWIIGLQITGMATNKSCSINIELFGILEYWNDGLLKIRVKFFFEVR